MTTLTLRINGAPQSVTLGENTAEAAREAGIATAAAADAATSAAAALAAVGTVEYADTAAGLAGTAEGATFWVDNGDGTGTVYRHDAGPTATQRGKFIKDITDTGAPALIKMQHPGAGGTETLYATARKTASLKSYGAVGGSQAADTAAMTAALANNDNILIDQTTTPFLVEPFTIQGDGQRIAGRGLLSALQMPAGETGAMISTGGYKAVLENFRLYGGIGGNQKLESAYTADRSGIAADYDKAVRLHKLSIEGFARYGVTAANAASSRAAEFSADILNIINCWQGVDAAKAEYTSWRRVNSVGGRLGFLIASGNLLLADSMVGDNYDNLKLYGVGDANNGHGGVSNCLFNHADHTAIHIEGITNGHLFDNCSAFYGAIQVINSKGVRFHNGTLSLELISCSDDGSGGYNEFSDNTFINSAPDGLINAVTHSGDDVQFIRNRDLDGNDVAGNAMLRAMLAAYTGTDQALLHLGEPGSGRETAGLRLTVHAGQGLAKFFGYSGGSLAAAAALSIDYVNSTVDQMKSGFGSYADDAAAATGGVGVGEVYINSSTKALTVRTA